MNVKEAKQLTLNAISNLSDADIKSAIKSLRDASNKRIARLEKADMMTPKAEQYAKTGTKSVRGMTRSELEQELKRQIGFSKTPQGSLLKQKKIVTRTQKALKKRGIQPSRKETAKGIMLFQRAVEKGLIVPKKPPSDQIALFVSVVEKYQTAIDAGKRKRMPTLQRLVDEAYEQGKEEENNAGTNTAVSDFIPKDEDI